MRQALNFTIIVLCTSTAFGQMHAIAIATGVAGPNGDFSIPRAHVGDIAFVAIRISNFDFAGHAIVVTNLNDQISRTSGLQNSTNLVPVPTTLTNLADSMDFSFSFMVQASDPDYLTTTANVTAFDMA